MMAPAANQSQSHEVSHPPAASTSHDQQLHEVSGCCHEHQLAQELMQGSPAQHGTSCHEHQLAQELMQWLETLSWLLWLEWQLLA